MKKKVVIVPNVGIGEIMLGMSREQLHSQIGLPSKSFFKSSKDHSMSEEYKDLGVFVYFDEKDTVAAIEAWNEADLIYKNLRLFKINYEDIIRVFKEDDSTLEILFDGIKSNNLGITTWLEDRPTKKSKCDSITLFKKGYL